MATMSYSSRARSLMGSTSISRIRVIARFSGRVMVPKVAMGAAVLFRPRSTRRARAEAMASGSGSSWIRISTRSAGSKWARSLSTLARVVARWRAGSRTRRATVVPGPVVTPAWSSPTVPSSVIMTTGAAGRAARSAASTRVRRADGTATTRGSSWSPESRRYPAALSRSATWAIPPRSRMRAAAAGLSVRQIGGSPPARLPVSRKRKSSGQTRTQAMTQCSMTCCRARTSLLSVTTSSRGARLAGVWSASDTVAVTFAIGARHQVRPLAGASEVPGLIAFAMIRRRGCHDLGRVSGHQHVAARAGRHPLHAHIAQVPALVVHGSRSLSSGGGSSPDWSGVSAIAMPWTFDRVRLGGEPSGARTGGRRLGDAGQLGQQDAGPAVNVVLADVGPHAPHAGATLGHFHLDGLPDGLCHHLQIVRVDEQGVRQLTRRSREAAENEHAVLVVAGRDEFLGHQVHAVVERRHHAEVGAPIEAIDLAVVVVPLPIDDRLPVAVAQGLVHRPHRGLDLVLELLVARDAAPARRGDLHEDDPAAILRPPFEEPANGAESLRQPFGVVDALDAHAQELGLEAETLQQGGPVQRAHVGGLGHADGEGPDVGGVLSPHRREVVPLDAAFDGALHRLQEVVAMELRVEADEVGPQHAEQDLLLPGADPERLEIRPGDVPEDGDP